MNYELMGAKIRQQRKLKRYTLEQLAEKLDVSTTFIGQIERAKGIPSLETIVKIANVLDVSIDSLLFGDLSNIAGNKEFLSQISELTSEFSAEEKQLVIKSIELMRRFKESSK